MGPAPPPPPPAVNGRCQGLLHCCVLLPNMEVFMLIDSKTSRRLFKFLQCLQIIANDLLTIYISVPHTTTLQPRTILESQWRLCKNVKISRVKLNAGNPRDVNATKFAKILFVSHLIATDQRQWEGFSYCTSGRKAILMHTQIWA
jgi:hypothetical protein